MLRITTHNDGDSLTFQLEGKLAGPWVRELEESWQRTSAWTRKPFIRFDLAGVTHVDAAGKEFLVARHAQGAELIATSAELTDIAYPVALRHGVAGSSIDLELDLWKALREELRRNVRASLSR